MEKKTFNDIPFDCLSVVSEFMNTRGMLTLTSLSKELRNDLLTRKPIKDRIKKEKIIQSIRKEIKNCLSEDGSHFLLSEELMNLMDKIYLRKGGDDLINTAFNGLDKDIREKIKEMRFGPSYIFYDFSSDRLKYPKEKMKYFPILKKDKFELKKVRCDFNYKLTKIVCYANVECFECPNNSLIKLNLPNVSKSIDGTGNFLKKDKIKTGGKTKIIGLEDQKEIKKKKKIKCNIM